jgi:phosphohistidine swiveling domain-containing protein
VERLAPLLATLQEIERLLGYDALDVEFAIDDAGVVHVLQVRPLVAAAAGAISDARFEATSASAHDAWRAGAESPATLPGCARPIYGVMPDWNPAEIIGTAPGRLPIDLYRRLVTDEVWAQQRAEYGYRDVRPHPLLRMFAGHPYVDVRASLASFLPAGLDDGLAGRLLAASIERLVAEPALHDKVEFAVVPTCVDPDWPHWDHRLQAEGFARTEREELRSALTTITSDAFARLDADLAAAGTLEQRASAGLRGVRDPLVRAHILLELTEQWGTLPFAHLARGAFVAVALLRGAEAQGVISSEAASGFLAGVRTVGHGLTEDARSVAEGRLAWDAFVARWGHLRPGTYDLTSPRYDQDPERFLRPLVMVEGARQVTETAHRDTWFEERVAFAQSLGRLGLPSEPVRVEAFLRRAIEGREWAKLSFTRTLSDALELLADGWEARGVGREDLVDVSLELLIPGLGGRVADAAQVREEAARGREARGLAAAVPLAPLLCTEADLDGFVLAADDPNFIGTKAVIAPVVVLSDDVDNWQEVAGRIVLVPRADPGFDWLFGHRIAGLVTLYGGANSHMAIRAAEFGLPAAIGVGAQRYAELAGAREVEIDAPSRTLRVVS